MRMTKPLREGRSCAVALISHAFHLQVITADNEDLRNLSMTTIQIVSLHQAGLINVLKCSNYSSFKSNHELLYILSYIWVLFLTKKVLLPMV